jgi:tellurite resistance protein
MLYVGRGLGSIAAWRSVEPALIDPSLRVDRSQPDHTGVGMSYWPSYTEISPQCRAAYLAWLAGGRLDPSAYIGYVFLFFYGLERRALADAPQAELPREELPVILAEVERLLAVYGNNTSFRTYATQLLDIVKLTTEEDNFQPPRERTGWELPMSLRIGIGRIVAAGKPLPADWALSWYLTHPDTSLRTPARRCTSEFGELFQVRYAKEFGEGVVLKRNKSKLKVECRPASASFGGPLMLSLDLPDIAPLSAPLGKIRSIAESCCSEIEAYSRWIGRNPDQPKSLAAMALLPREIAASHAGAEAHALWNWIQETIGPRDRALVHTQELLRRCPISAGSKLSKGDTVLLAQLIEKRDFGIEPDVRFGGALVANFDSAILFKLPTDAAAIASPQYAGAAVLLHLAVAVSAADGTISRDEEGHLEQHLEKVLVLSEAERIRLSAHLAWLRATKPGMGGLKKRLEALNEEQRSAIADFIVGVAGADGQITPDEIRTLEKIYPLLGLAADDVYKHLHAMTAGGPADIVDSAEPVTVIPAQSVQGFAIPARPSPARTVHLNMATVEAKLAQSAKISAILDDIFTEDEPAPQVAIPPTPETGKLSTVYAVMLRRLIERPAWSRSEFDSLAGELGLLPDGALDTINEASLDHLDITVIEGNDPITLDLDAAKELLA